MSASAALADAIVALQIEVAQWRGRVQVAEIERDEALTKAKECAEAAASNARAKAREPAYEALAEAAKEMLASITSTHIGREVLARQALVQALVTLHDVNAELDKDALEPIRGGR